jgi:hypothetical protein
MMSSGREGVRLKLYELCPEMEQLGILPIILEKTNRY